MRVGVVVLAALVVGCSGEGTSSSSSGSSSSGGSSSGGSASTATSSASGRSSSRSAGSGSSSSDMGTSGGVAFDVGNAAYGEMHVPLADGASVDVISGPQGGYHIWLSVGFPAQPPMANPRIGFEVNDAAQRYAMGTTVMSPQEHDGAWWDVGAYMFFDWGITLDGWTDHPIDVTVRLLDENDTELGRVVRHWNATCCVGGGTRGDTDGGLVDGESPDAGAVGGGGLPSCAEFCTHVMDGCADQAVEPPFPSTDACVDACAQWPVASFGPDDSGNTLVCREYYARAAEEDPGACARLVESWTNFCVDRP